MKLFTILSFTALSCIAYFNSNFYFKQNEVNNSAYNSSLKDALKITNTQPGSGSTLETTASCDNWLHIPNYNTQDYVAIGDLDITGNQITVEASFNADTNYFIPSTVSYDLVSKHTGPSDCNYLLRPVTAEITTTNGFVQIVACDYKPKKINHAALVYDGSTLKFYRNGFLMGTKPASGNLITNDLITKIGNYSFGSLNGSLKGYMNEVRIWNVARTKDQIKTYMNASLPNPTTQTGLVAYYTFDNLNNKQGNATWNGTLHGAATINNTVPDCNFIADSCGGIIPGAESCSTWLHIPNYNTQDYVAIGDLDITGNQITVEASFNADTNYFVTGTVSYDLVSKHTNPGDCNYLLRPVTAEITTTDGYYQVIACDYIPKKINHAALVYDGSTLKFYRNGFLMGSRPASGNLVTNDLVAKIGNYAEGSEVGALKGYMNEVRIWNVARTEDQVKMYMHASLPNPSSQTGLVAYYVFDNLNNKQGNALWDGSLHGAATINNTVPDCNFIADSCGGVTPVSCSNWLKMPDKLTGVTIGDLDITGNQMTIEAMCNASDIYALSRSLVSKHEDPSDVNYFLCPDLAQITTSNGFFSATSPCSFVSNKTYHAAMVYNGSSLKLYRNGFLMQEVPASGNLVTNSWPATIGEYAYSMFSGQANISNIFKGYINEVRIWNVERTQEQIQTYMNSSLPDPATQTGLLAYYTFDDLNNKQGNATYNGTLQGAATISNANPNCNFVADSCPIAVPVTLTSFYATAINNKKIVANWHTEQENGIANYIVERAVSASGPFISICTVNAKNSGNNDYSITDNTARPNVLYFYRLRITENTGTKKYSGIKQAIIKTNELFVTVYPNPANNLVTVLLANTKEAASVILFNSMGQIISNQRTVMTNNTATITIDINRLAKGSYFIEIITSKEKIIKQLEKL